MRLREYAQLLRFTAPVIFAVLAASSASAQFREILPERSPQQTASDLVPTTEPFVPPAVDTPPPAVETTPDVRPMDRGQEGTPSAVDPHAQTELKPVVVASKPVTQPKPAAEPAPSVTADTSENSNDEPPPEEIEEVDPFAAFRTKPDGGLAAPSPSDRPHHAPLTFNRIEPGSSSLERLKSEWGEPAKTVKDGKSQILVYQVPGFRQVDVFVNHEHEQIESILIHLMSPSKAVELQAELGLAALDPVVIPDSQGRPLAQGFPERGVLLTYSEEAQSDIVTHISLETIQGELFRLRAEHDLEHQDARCLRDLEQATRLDPEDHYAYWLQAEMLSRVGRSKDALDSVKIANRIESSNPLYRLTLARIQASNGQLEEATRITQAILDDPDTKSIVRARAEYQRGNLMAVGPEPDYENALTHHMKAIDLAVKHVGDESFLVRRMAKDILVDTHLAIAQDIALGNFQRKREVVPKWLTRATQLGEDFISRDAGDETIRMEIYRSTLAIYSVLDGSYDPSIAAEEALKEGRRLIAQADDDMYQARIERELSEALLHASKVEHRRGRAASAMTYASNAVALLEGQNESRQPSLFDRIMEGQLYFLLGSLYAVNRNDHEEAVNWYERAKPMFDDEGLANLVDSSSFGDLFVSMGVSYWEADQKEKAVQMSQIGAELMQQAVQAGSLELAALAIPYGNLAAMHRNLGNPTEAEHFAQMMAKVEETTTQQR